jgi:hypothetical protein
MTPPFRHRFSKAPRASQLAEACYESSRDRRWIDLPTLTL